jgi:3D (Asp-Asp-Asp) domain-containing protein
MTRYVPTRRQLAVWLLRLGIGFAVGETVQAQEACSVAVITGYSVEQYPGRTTDGTPTPGNVGVIVAASMNYTLGSHVTVEGLGTYRVADRGHLGANHIDVLFERTIDAIHFGRQTRTVCVERWGEGR